MILQLKPLVATDQAATLEPVQWSSLASMIASVDANGMVTAIAPGTTVVSAKSGTVTDMTTVTVQPRSGATIVAAGDLACGVTAASGAVCWGNNEFGQSGTGLTAQSLSIPTQVAGGITWKSLAASANHVCGLDAGGDVYCWGLNAVGQLGLGNESAPVRTPTRVVGGKKFVSVSAGGSRWFGIRDIDLTDSQQTCALTLEGAAYCWGLAGSFATTGETSSNTPRPVATGVRFASISVGYGYVCGVSIDRRGYCWGSNDLGQLGRARDPFDRGPKLVEGGLRFEQISAGGVHTCGLTTDKTAYCWGANDALQLGGQSTEQCNYRGQVVQCQTHPVAVSGGYKFNSISAGAWPLNLFFAGLVSHSCGITIAEDVVCWGWNGAAQVRAYRDDETASQFRGPTVAELAGIKFRAVATNAGSSCAVTVAGLGYCWGVLSPHSVFGPGSFDERFK
jgi:alpha-tubulin suppressor-like RCC1 family protein